MELKITLTDAQVNVIAEKVSRKLAESNQGKRTKPYSIKEFSDATGISRTTFDDRSVSYSNG